MNLQELQEKGKIKIKPYIDPKKQNMGLEQYDLVTYPTTIQSETMACVDNKGKLRYLNGLDEFAPEIKAISNKEVREAKIKEIREIVTKLEKEYAYNADIKVDDENFWSKVTTFRPDNRDVFGKIVLQCGNDEKTLNPLDSLDDMLTVRAIEAGGFSLVAKSYEDLISGAETKKWYLDKEIVTVNHQITPIKAKNKALSMLDDLYDNNVNKLFYIVKTIMTKSIVYKRNTFSDIIYKDLDDYINGKLQEKEIGKAARLFMEVSEMSMEDLKIKAAIKDLIYTKDIVHKSDGMLYINKSNVIIGRNVAEALEYFKNPGNDDQLRDLLKTAEKLWQE